MSRNRPSRQSCRSRVEVRRRTISELEGVGVKGVDILLLLWEVEESFPYYFTVKSQT